MEVNLVRTAENPTAIGTGILKRDFANLVDKDLEIRCHHSSRPLDTNGLSPAKVYIFAYATLTGTDNSKSIERIKTDTEEYLLDAGQTYRYMPSTREREIVKQIKDENGTMIAGVYKNYIMIYFDLLHSSSSVKPIIRYIVNKAKPHLKFLSREELEEFNKKELNQAILTMVSERIENELKSLTDNIDSLKSKVQDYNKDIVAKLRDLGIAEKELECAKNIRCNLDRQMNTELQAILKNKWVETIYSEDGKIYIRTTPIKISKYELGKYTICIADNNIASITSDKSTNDIHHPHIIGKGTRIC